MDKIADVRADVSKNRLYIVLSGFFPDEEMGGVADRVISEASKLKPGFDVINDVSNFKPTSPRGADEIKRGQTFLQQHGLRRLIRVSGDAVLAAAQFDRQAKASGYTADTAVTVAEAERMLDGK